jgi:hypothetical protein
MPGRVGDPQDAPSATPRSDAVIRRLRIAVLALGLAVLGLGLFLGTSGGRHWSSDSADRAGGALASPGPNPSVASAPPSQVPPIPARRSLRICCALGFDLGVSFVGLPIPIVEAGAALDVENIRQHHYDGGGMGSEFLSVIDGKLGYSIPDVEQNGLLYTCRGGFVDTSHIRELVDWTAFLFSHFDRTLETGGRVELEEEGATRTFVSRPVPVELIEKLGRDHVVLRMAQWSAYQTSVWHETAQWYGFSIWSLYPETNSGFSPEDPFANGMGVLLLDGVDDVRAALQSSESFNRVVESRIAEDVRALGPFPHDVTIAALEAVDGLWWDSQVRIPGKAIVIRREFEVADGVLRPWLLPDRVASPALRETLAEQCGPDPQPEVLRVSQRLGDVPVSDFVTFEIELAETFAGLPAFAGRERFDQAYFPNMVAKVRQESLIEFGAGSDRPD